MGMTAAINTWQIAAIILVCVGVIGLGVVEATENPDLRAARQEASNRKYAKSWLALCLPLAYCLLDALGSFADSLVLADPNDPEAGIPAYLKMFACALDEDQANVAYELTFFAAAVICFIYLWFKNDLQRPRQTRPRFVGAIFETAGQFAYIYALADTAHVALSAPIISAYCAASVLWSRLFLKEKLSWKHYVAILCVVTGIVILGVFDG
jgi:drug/metabolite transporter (DMT)-like permease